MTMLRRAIFVDRDGTLSEKTGPVADPEHLRLLPRTAAAIRRINHSGWQVIVVTDQPGIAFDEFDENVLANVHDRLRLLLLEDGARLDGIYHCPHHPEGKVERYRRDCACRKPGIALFERARDEMGIVLNGSFFVGDSPHALQAAAACGMPSVLVRTGEGRETEAALARIDVAPAQVVDTIEDAANWALAPRVLAL
jgi:D-glycero-D-manno-heptose 1,7-bisphosphate phosphatase